MNFGAGPPSGSFLKYETPKTDFDKNPLRCDSIDVIASERISAKFTRCPNSAIKADCCDSNGASNTKVFGGYFAVRAPTKFHFITPFSS